MYISEFFISNLVYDVVLYRELDKFLEINVDEVKSRAAKLQKVEDEKIAKVKKIIADNEENMIRKKATGNKDAAKAIQRNIIRWKNQLQKHVQAKASINKRLSMALKIAV